MTKNDSNYLNLDNLNSFNSIFSLSFILTGNYIFWSNSFLFKPFLTILNESFFLFIFTFLILKIIVKFFFLISTININQNLIIFLKIVFFCWITIQAIKGFFFLANSVTLPQLISNTFSLITSGDIELKNRIIIFFTPYFFIFILLYLLRNNLDKILRVCISTGYIFLIMSIFICFERYNSFKSKPLLLNQKISTENVNKGKKVLWFIFDGFDPIIAFDDKETSPNLETFNNLRNYSFEHKRMYPPAKYTRISMLSMFLGKHPVGDNIIKNYKIHLNTDSGLIPFTYENTIFAKFEKLGLSSAIFSTVFPYCVFLPEIKDCFSPTDQDETPPEYSWYNGILFIYSIKSKSDLFINLINKKNNNEVNLNKSLNKLKYDYIPQLSDIKKVLPKINFDKLEEMEWRECCKDSFKYSDIKSHIENLNKNLTFIHLFPPHTTGHGDLQGGDFAQEIFKINTTLDGRGVGLGSYVLNLKLADLLLNKILKNLKEEDKKDLMIILSSDHWYRDKDKRTRNAYPALFIVKIYGDNSKIEMHENSSLYNVHDLISSYFEDKISTHSDIKEFFKKKTFYKTFIVH